MVQNGVLVMDHHHPKESDTNRASFREGKGGLSLRRIFAPPPPTHPRIYKLVCLGHQLGLLPPKDFSIQSPPPPPPPLTNEALHRVVTYASPVEAFATGHKFTSFESVKRPQNGKNQGSPTLICSLSHCS